MRPTVLLRFQKSGRPLRTSPQRHWHQANKPNPAFPAGFAKAVRIKTFIALLSFLLGGVPVHAQLRGHGGPVRAVAISSDGKTAVSGSFDTSAINWSLRRNVAGQVLRFHDAAVNAVAILPDGRIATGGADARIAIWRLGAPQPVNVFDGHTGPVVGLAVSPDGMTLASASWDHTARLWPLAGGMPRLLQ